MYLREVKGYAPKYTKNNAYYALKSLPSDRLIVKPEYVECYEYNWEKGDYEYTTRQLNLMWQEPTGKREPAAESQEELKRKSWQNTKRKVCDLMRQNYRPSARFITITIQAPASDEEFKRLIQKFGELIKRLGGGLLGVFERQKRGTLHLHGMIICDGLIKANEKYIVKIGQRKKAVSKQEATDMQEKRKEGIYLYGDKDIKAGIMLRDRWREIIKKAGIEGLGTVCVKEMISNNGAEAIANYMGKYLSKDLEGLNKQNLWGNKFRHFRSKDFFQEPQITYREISEEQYTKVRNCKYGFLVVKKNDEKADKWFRNEIIKKLIDKYRNKAKQDINTDISTGYDNITGYSTAITYGFK